MSEMYGTIVTFGGGWMIGYEEALAATLEAIVPLPGELAPLGDLAGRVLAEDVIAPEDSPALDVSLKDGYAVRSADVAGASPHSPVRLRLVGQVAAGGAFAGEMGRGETIRILSGAPLPEGADAILAEEYASCAGDGVTARADAAPGRNILPRGADLARGQLLARAGTVLRPPQVGLLAAAGCRAAPVVQRPRVGLVATGDELLGRLGSDSAPEAAGSSMIFPSNLAALAAWCSHYGMATSSIVVGDDPAVLRATLLDQLADNDAVLTSGGAWTSERDLVSGVFEELGWREIYHRIRLGPGKGAGFGLWQGKPVFLLPGGPASNQMAFLQLALPGLHRLMGRPLPGLPVRLARLTEAVSGQLGWTEFIEGRFDWDGPELRITPRKGRSRLGSMAACEGYIKVPEGVETLAAGTVVPVQVLPDVPALHRERAKDALLPLIVSFVAWSGTGKTTFLERLLPELKARGLRVGVLKHHAHATTFDVPGKDTHRMAAAGADVVVGVGSLQTAVFIPGDASADIAGVIRQHLGAMDLVIIEGYKRGRYPKIEVYRAEWAAADGRAPGLLCQPDELLALVTDVTFPLPATTPQFGLEDSRAVAQFLADRAAAHRAVLQGAAAP